MKEAEKWVQEFGQEVVEYLSSMELEALERSLLFDVDCDEMVLDTINVWIDPMYDCECEISLN